MRKTLISLMALGIVLAAAIGLPAQEQDKSAAAEAKLASIMDELQASFQKWRKEQMKKMQEHQKAVKKAEAEGKEAPPAPMMSMKPPTGMFKDAVDKLAGAAAEYKGADEAIGFHATILELAALAEAKDAAMAAAEALTTDHIKSTKLDRRTIMTLVYSGRLIGQDKADAFLAKIATNSPHASVRAEAGLAPLRPILEDAAIDSTKYKEAKAQALKVANASGDADLITEIKNLINGRESMGVGAIAPDISGVDLDGTAFKLSDYKGKIILLDFWGDW